MSPSLRLVAAAISGLVGSGVTVALLATTGAGVPGWWFAPVASLSLAALAGSVAAVCVPRLGRTSAVLVAVFVSITLALAAAWLLVLMDPDERSRTEQLAALPIALAVFALFALPAALGGALGGGFLRGVHPSSPSARSSA